MNDDTRTAIRHAIDALFNELADAGNDDADPWTQAQRQRWIDALDALTAYAQTAAPTYAPRTPQEPTAE